MTNPSFSFNGFRSWLSKQSEDASVFFDLESSSNTTDDKVGKKVLCKVGKKKLMEKMEVQEGNKQNLLKDIIENGGEIVALKGKDLLIEVESGTFYIPRFCVKII